MRFFDFEKSVKDIEYYEILDNLMERWEYEVVEFKEAKVILTQIRLDVIFLQ